jgi:preprotein translocase subunit SecB
MLSVLQLTRHYFTEIWVQANPALKTLAPTEDYDIAIQSSKETLDAQGHWHLAVTVVLTDSKKEAPARYTAKLTVHGDFTLHADVPEDKRSRIVRANGGALLLSAAREMLIAVTARSAHGPLELAVFDPRVFLEAGTEPRPPLAP